VFGSSSSSVVEVGCGLELATSLLTYTMFFMKRGKIKKETDKKRMTETDRQKQ
jgi:hypothetical protein